MAWIHRVEDGQAEGELARLYEAARDPVSGQLDNIMKVHSLHPEGLSAHLALYTAVMRPSPGLPRAEREMIALLVSRRNGCRY